MAAIAPKESPALYAVAQVNQDAVRELGLRCAEQKLATLDLDSTIIEIWKKEARRAYEGSTSYQPMLALSAEMIPGWQCAGAAAAFVGGAARGSTRRCG